MGPSPASRTRTPEILASAPAAAGSRASCPATGNATGNATGAGASGDAGGAGVVVGRVTGVVVPADGGVTVVPMALRETEATGVPVDGGVAGAGDGEDVLVTGGADGDAAGGRGVPVSGGGAVEGLGVREDGDTVGPTGMDAGEAEPEPARDDVVWAAPPPAR